MKKLQLFIYAGFLMGCGSNTMTGYQFHTRASYMLEDTGLKIEIESKGAVPAGADVGTGNAIGWLCCDHCHDSLLFQKHEEGVWEFLWGGHLMQGRDEDDFLTQITNYSQGYNLDVSSVEAIEARRLILGASSGPKGTYMEGQPQHFKVIDVAFDRY